jgi:[protein-PII] uridylyltransferase
MPPDYLRSATSEEVIWHLDLISGIEGTSNLGTRSSTAVDTAVVVGWHRPGFRRRVAEALAANGIDVLEARLLNRSDGLVLDTFRVRDDRTRTSVRPDKWSSVRVDIEAGVQGELDTLSKVTSRAAAYDEAGGMAPVVSASVDAASGDLVLTVKCTDRIGRLAEILTALSDCGLEIRLAQIDSREGEVIDTFHVTGDVSDPVDMNELEGRIAVTLSS